MLEIIASIDFNNQTGHFAAILDGNPISDFAYGSNAIVFTEFNALVDATFAVVKDGIRQLRIWMNLIDSTFSPAREPINKFRCLLNKKDASDNTLYSELQFGNKHLLDHTYALATGFINAPIRPEQTRTWAESLLWLAKYEEFLREIENFA